MRIRLFASLREAAGVREVELAVEPGTALREVVEQLVAERPSLAGRLIDGQGKLRDAVSIFANGRNVRLLDGLATRLQGDEELAIFPPIAGGCRRA